jgi:hypothetical protein
VHDDPSVLGWYCGDLAETLVSPFGCELQLVDGADVAARAEQLRAAMPALWGATDRRLLRPLLGPLASQHALGGDLAAEDLSVGPSSLAVAVARGVWLSADFAPDAPPDAAALVELGATELPPAEVSVIALQPDATPPEPLAPAAVRSFRPSVPRSTSTSRPTAATRTLANGLTVFAIQRTDTRLYHVSLRLLPASQGLEQGAWLAASMAYDSPPTALLTDRLVDWGYGRAGLIHDIHARTLTAALDDLTVRALRPRFDLSTYATDTVRWSLTHGGQTPGTRDDDGYTAIHLAAAANKPKVLQLMLDMCRRSRELELIDLRDGSGDEMTALMMASANGNEACVRELLYAGAKPGLLCGAGLTAEAYARRKGHAALLTSILSSPNCATSQRPR